MTALAIGALAVTALWGLRTFPVRPSVLLASLGDRLKASDAEAQTAFRDRFHHHLADVCAALQPRTMTVFIDDLDRCEPAKAAEVLEAVNYLVGSGACFVVLGLAREVVEAQLVQQFEKLAEAFETVQSAEVGHHAAAPNDQHGRVGYARDYLRKLINLDIRIPVVNGEQVARMLVPSAGDAKPLEPGRRARIVRVLEGWEAAVGRWTRPIVWVATAAIFLSTLVPIVRGFEGWNLRRNERLATKRQQVAATLESVHDAERRTLVALDLAKEGQKEAAHVAFDLPPAPAGSAKTVAVPAVPCVEASSVAPAGSAADGGATGQPQPMTALDCWKERAEMERRVEDEVSAARSAVTEAENAKTRDQFGLYEKAQTTALGAAAMAEREVGLVRAPAAPAAPAPAPSATQAPPSPDALASPDEQVARSLVHREAPRGLGSTWWAPALAFVLFAIAVLRMTRDEHAVVDSQHFADAIRIWAPVIASVRALSAPREVRRFGNKARYFAMRLRPAPARRSLARRLLGGPPPAPQPDPFPEPFIVALTAVHHLRPDLIEAVVNEDLRPKDHLSTQIARALKDTEKLAVRPTYEQTLSFLGLVTEFGSDDSSPR
jgi:KAP family P-loop domain